MNSQIRKFGTLASVSLLILCSSLNAYAAPGTLPVKPLINTNSGVDPNIFITTDDSGSMQWELIFSQNATKFKDDEGLPLVNSTKIDTIVPGWAWKNTLPALNLNDPNDEKWVFYNYNANKLYYDSEIDYEPWPGLDVDGTALFSDASITAVLKHPVNSTSTKNLVNSSSSNFYPPIFCTWDKDNNNNGLDETDDHTCIEIKNDGKKYPSGRDYAGEIQNFANWMQYFRSRELAANNALGTVIDATINARMGISYINDSNFPKIALKPMSVDINKVNLLKNLYAHNSPGGTPLRAALRKTGEMFKDSSNYFSADAGGECQQNFNILMSDGYWNQSDPSGIYNEDSDTDGAKNTQFDGNSLQSNDGGNYADSYSRTLADVAMYYYENDLVPGLADKVPTASGYDLAPHQHLVNYAVAFGLAGNLSLNADPLADGFKWPQPVSGTPSTLDDLRHAAYNSRGLYLSADNPQTLLDSLLAAIMNITERATIASAAAVTSSKLTTDSTVYLAEYNSDEWRGTVLARKPLIDPATNKPVASGELDSTPVWDSGKILTSRDISADPRTIFTYDSANKKGIPFKWDATTDVLTKAMKDDLRTYCSSTTVNTTAVATDGCVNYLGSTYCPATWSEYKACKLIGESYKPKKYKYYCLAPDAANNTTPTVNLNCTTETDDIAKLKLEYLRGDRSNEGTDFRVRGSLLGDIVNSGPIYVQAPSLSFPDIAPFPTDTPYSTFKAAKKSRKAVVYTGANDGMFHAFDATEPAANATTSTAGREIMAYIPSYLFSTESNRGLHYLTNKQYLHQFYNDLQATVSDAYIGSGWKTILVGGQRAGGRGYFALDITNPENFSTNIATTPLWEFSSQDDVDLGYSYSRPQIGMLNDGTWVAIFGNGYNSTGTGEAQLFVVKLSGPTGINGWVEGTDYIKITTGTSTLASPLADTNGLSTPALADVDGDSTIDRAYAGDLKGNLWVFDLKGGFNQLALAYSSPLFSTEGKPITTKPILSIHPTQPKSGNEPNLMVYFGSGQFLIDTDPNDTTSVNNFYGVWDKGQPSSTLTSANLVEQVWSHTAGTVPTDNAVDYTGSAYGWTIQLPVAGERSITEATVRGSAVIFNSTVPTSSPCSLEGLGYRYAVDLATGSFPTEPVLDLNNDNIIDDNDIVTSGSSVSPVTTLSDFPTNNTFTDEKVASGDQFDTIAALLKPKTGRLSWQELLK